MSKERNYWVSPAGNDFKWDVDLEDGSYIEKLADLLCGKEDESDSIEDMFNLGWLRIQENKGLIKTSPTKFQVEFCSLREIDLDVEL